MEWPTLVFFMGLFIMVGGLVEVGVIGRIGEAVTGAVGDRYLLAASALLWGSAALSGIVDNIPYVATMTPLVQSLVDAGHGAQAAKALWWALALGADLGGNATAVGASANVVIIGIAARNGHPISFWHFTRYGVVVAVGHHRRRLGLPLAALLRLRVTAVDHRPEPGTRTAATMNALRSPWPVVHAGAVSLSVRTLGRPVDIQDGNSGGPKHLHRPMWSFRGGRVGGASHLSPPTTHGWNRTRRHAAHEVRRLTFMCRTARPSDRTPRASGVVAAPRLAEHVGEPRTASLTGLGGGH